MKLRHIALLAVLGASLASTAFAQQGMGPGSGMGPGPGMGQGAGMGPGGGRGRSRYSGRLQSHIV